jgi:hypothetical protein
MGRGVGLWWRCRSGRERKRDKRSRLRKERCALYQIERRGSCRERWRGRLVMRVFERVEVVVRFDIPLMFCLLVANKHVRLLLYISIHHGWLRSKYA